MATPTGQFVARWQAASQAAKPAGSAVTAEQALATPELKALLDEFAAVAGAYRRQLLDARAAGKPPRACPPSQVDLTVDAVLAEVQTLPAAWQSREFADSFGAVMDKRYPCASLSARG
ncbi:hypothetical protein ACNFJ7_05510 [Sphingomonas sp. HT-1]|uniref:hypothetical protein n=1 Tax=unclassified Sphingomonas TaxID=196159 RepID=UPI0002EA46F1|nr:MULTISPECIES: hypothetical protein [unclassified Sphingomonas]KTF67511.1 hypothetical protein ATB93_17375 [Sphingomonas sp. WG]